MKRILICSLMGGMLFGGAVSRPTLEDYRRGCFASSNSQHRCGDGTISTGDGLCEGQLPHSGPPVFEPPSSSPPPENN